MDIYWELRQALKDALARNHNDRDGVATSIGVSRQTLELWLKGRSLPNPLMTPPVISALQKI